MKNVFLIFLIGTLVSACSSMGKFNSNDITKSEIEYRKSTNQGIKIGDKIKTYN